MARTFIAPSKYVQGPGELANLGGYVDKLGKRALVIISEGGIRREGAVVDLSFEGVEALYDYAPFEGECTKAEIDRLVALAKENGADVVVGIGGGKIFDTAKAVAYYLGSPVAICPTIAATDAACSALSVVYTAEGAVENYLFLSENPDLVLVDTAVIAKSPVRLTVSGMGDALATYFEARAVARHNGDNFAAGHPGLLAPTVARLCYDTLIERGAQAKVALEAGALTDAVEDIVEANTLLSGLGFESGGLAAAHAIHNGLSILPECHSVYHGEKVAFGTLAQLVLENVDEDELDEVLGFCLSVGLPVTLGQIGVTDVTWEKLMAVAEVSCAEADTMGQEPFAVTPEMVANALLAADAMGRAALAGWED